MSAERDTAASPRSAAPARQGFVLWFTGLSGAGKSTLSRHLAPILRERGLLVEVLDGDEVRENLSRGLSFSKEDRDINVRRIGFVANLLARNGVCAMTAAISPYASVRAECRAMAEVPFVEVHVHAPLAVVEGRDVKGLYRRARAGEIPHFTGVSDPYEEPAAPDVRVDTSALSLEQAAERVLDHLAARGLLLG